MSESKRRRIIVDEEVDNDMDDRERFVNVNDEYKRDEDNESVGSNPDDFEEEVNEDEGEGEDLAETWDKYVVTPSLLYSLSFSFSLLVQRL